MGYFFVCNFVHFFDVVPKAKPCLNPSASVSNVVRAGKDTSGQPGLEPERSARHRVASIQRPGLVDRRLTRARLLTIHT